MWASMLLSPYLHPKLRSLGTELYRSPHVNVRCALVYIPSLVGSANNLFSLSSGMFVGRLLVFLLRPKCALVLGNDCERLCASRPLLGSYVHQESI